MTREVVYRVDVLRDGAPITELRFTPDEAPQIIASRSASIRTSLKGTFLPNDVIAWESDELRPSITIDGVETYLGIFQAATVKKTGTETSRRAEVEAYDRCWRVSVQKTENILHLSAGAGYLDTIQQLLTACGINLVLATPSSAVLAEDREDWSVGTSYLTVINALLDEINYEPVWFDATGVCRLQPYQEADVSGIKWRYGTTTKFLPAEHPTSTWADETDLFDAPNVFVVTCANPDKTGDMVATAVNENPGSSKSTFRRGMRITSVTKVDNIADQEALQAYADRLRNESLISSRSITFYTLAEPGHGIGDIIALTHDDIGGIYIETGWTLTLSAGNVMTHTAKRTVIA